MSEKRRMTEGHITVDYVSRANLLKGVDFDPSKAVNVGCGHDYIEGWINIDGDAGVDPDHVVELDIRSVRLPFEDNSMDLVYCCHILEHIRHLPELKREFHRILKPGGNVVVVVPHYLSPDAWGDDTHCRGFSFHSFYSTYWPGFNEKFRYMEFYIKGPDNQEVSKKTFTPFSKGDLLWISALRSKNEQIAKPA
jgi:SAM-dependent methyltransferase